MHGFAGTANSRRHGTDPMPSVLIALFAGLLAAAAVSAHADDGEASRRLAACTACHGAEGRASSAGFLPRIAGKPADYLYRQLLAFRDGQRQHAPMQWLLAPLRDDTLREIAGHFAASDPPYPPPAVSGAPAALMRHGETLATRGDPARGIPACAACHGATLTGVLPGTPGLLGLPRDYLNAQLGAWRNQQRRAAEPDCMARIAARLTPEDVGAVSTWLASQPMPALHAPAARLPSPAPMDCGSVPAVGGAPAARPASASTPRSPAAGSALPSSAATADPLLARGAYLARAGNCVSCHTAPGGDPLAGGRAIETPFGTVYSSNLTPDPDTGLGAWRAQDFRRALHEGRSRDGRLLSPAFPYPYFTRMTAQDADAIFAWLRSQAPVRQPDRPHEMRWPFGTQWALTIWRSLAFRSGGAQPDASRPADWQRGAYLVEVVGHCGACHAPRDRLGATRPEGPLAGGPVGTGRWLAPSLLSPGEAGVQHWPAGQIAQWLATGRTAGASAMGPMAEVISHGTRHLTEPDRLAIATYLRALPVVRPEPARPPAAAVPAGPAGAALYREHCADCHGNQGQGRGAWPALAGNRAVTQPEPGNLITVVLRGGFAADIPGEPRPHGMPPFAHRLDDTQVAALVSWLRASWGHQATPVSVPQVQQARR